MMPVIAWNALLASTILREAMNVLRTRCVDGITANPACARAARPEHGRRNGAQPAHRLRRDGGDREGIDQDRPLDPRARARARVAGREASRRDSLGSGHDERRDHWRQGISAHGVVGAAARRAGRHRGRADQAERPAVRAAGSRAARRSGSRSVAEARTDHGRPRHRRRLHRRRPGRRRRLVHDPPRAPRRPERPRVRRRHSAADDRGDRPARAARGPAQRAHGARHGERSAAARRASTPCSSSTRITR